LPRHRLTARQVFDELAALHHLEFLGSTFVIDLTIRFLTHRVTSSSMDIGLGGGKVDDETEIRALIGLHFEGMRWGSGTEPDWDSFRADFISGAILMGGARPVVVRSPDGFIERMETVARKNLHSFEEHTRATATYDDQLQL
jgi:hypothetical protein